MSGQIDTYEWDAEPGWLVLFGGERVWIERGDEVHGYETADGNVQFVDVSKQPGASE